MQRLKLTKVLYPVLLVSVLMYAEEVDVEWHPLSLNGGLEVGQLVNSTYWDNADVNYDGYVFPKLGIAMTYHALVEKRLDIQMGVGGLFWYAFPHGEGNFWEVTTRFGPGVTKAQARFIFGDPEDSRTYLQVGYFPIKYNPDAMNLGEYLFRSGAYPGFVRTGGWVNVNSAGFMAQGVRFHMENLEGALKHDFTLFLEKEFWPYNDISPSYVVSFKAGMLEVGGGVCLHHFIPVKPSYLESKRSINHYIELEYLPPTAAHVVGNDTIIPHRPQGGPIAGSEYDLGQLQLLDTTTGVVASPSVLPLEQRKHFDRITRTNVNEEVADADNENLYIDSAGNLYTQATAPPTAWRASSPVIKRYVETDIPQYAQTGFYYTHKGVKLMGRISLDFNQIIGADLKLFAEAALLGVANYDHYYEEPARRIPVMFGMNIPTFGLLDALSVQGEYYNSSIRNSLLEVYAFAASPPASSSDDATIVDKDNFHWSIYTKKTLVPGLQLFVQAASDHLRLINAGYAYINDPLTVEASQWYYIARLEFGI